MEIFKFMQGHTPCLSALWIRINILMPARNTGFSLCKNTRMQQKLYHRKKGGATSFSSNSLSYAGSPKLYRNEEKRDVQDKLMAFFDAETMEEKYQILLDMRGEINDRMINNMAVVLNA